MTGAAFEYLAPLIIVLCVFDGREGDKSEWS